MFVKFIKSAPLYLSITGMILTWWAIAFQTDCHPKLPLQHSSAYELGKQLHPHFFQAHLTPMERSTLQKALNGDLQLMVKLIADWDVDAKIFDSHGLNRVKHLPDDAFIRSQILGRLLAHHSPEKLKEIKESYRLKSIVDDSGLNHSLPSAYERFLPQTFVAASFLLALVDPEQIVAIPRGIREQTHLFSPLLTNQIHYDLDRHLSERIYQARPQVAFISHYSHPSTFEALRNQGVQLFTLNSIDSLPDIHHALMRVGNVINRPLEAELMTIFMEAAMIAVDNRLLAADQCYGTHYANQRTLYLNFYQQYTTPTAKTLTWQLLNRLGVQHSLPPSLIAKHNMDWTIPMNHEQIVQYDPECIIVSTTHREAMKRQIDNTPAFKTLTAVQNQRIFFVDESIQQSPSQYVVLAYFDLAQALTHERLNDISIVDTEILTKYP